MGTFRNENLPTFSFRNENLPALEDATRQAFLRMIKACYAKHHLLTQMCPKMGYICKNDTACESVRTRKPQRTRSEARYYRVPARRSKKTRNKQVPWPQCKVQIARAVLLCSVFAHIVFHLPSDQQSPLPLPSTSISFSIFSFSFFLFLFQSL